MLNISESRVPNPSSITKRRSLFVTQQKLWQCPAKVIHIVHVEQAVAPSESVHRLIQRNQHHRRQQRREAAAGRHTASAMFPIRQAQVVGDHRRARRRCTPLPQDPQQDLVVDTLVVAGHIKTRHVAMAALLPHDTPQGALDAAVALEVDAGAVQ